MKLSLKALLFEEEDKKSVPIENNIQALRDNIIEKISNFVKDKLNTQIPDPNEIKINDLGVFNLQKLNKISNIPIKTYKVSAAQITGSQQSGTTATDLIKYKKLQIVPLIIRNDKEENLGSERQKQEYVAVFLMPIIGAEIDLNNIDLHNSLFETNLSPEKSVHTKIQNIPRMYIKPDEIEKFQTAIKNGTKSFIERLIKLKTQRISTVSQEKGKSTEAQKEVYYRKKLVDVIFD